MSHKKEILQLLKNKPLTQSELAFAIYGDNRHMPNIHSALLSLVNDDQVIRTGNNPYLYSLPYTEISTSRITSKAKKNKIHSDVTITNELVEKAHKCVMQTENYGKEDALITNTFSKFPYNIDLKVVAMKIGLIDITNSTNISRYKSKISVVELAECIIAIKNIDERIRAGDPEVVNEIARCNGKINLFSFASKYCCYHNKNVYKKDDYSIIDTILKDSLPRYFNDVTSSQIKKWQKTFDYKKYNDYITKKLDELGITLNFRKRKFDHFVWYTNR